MQKYELTYLIVSDTNLQGAEEKAKAIESFVASQGGNVITKEQPVAKTLAYPIAKKSSGLYGVMLFELPQENVKAIEEFLKKDDRLARTLLVKTRSVKMQTFRKEPQPFTIERKYETISRKEVSKEPVTQKPKKEEKKVELKDIEEQLEKILSE